MEPHSALLTQSGRTHLRPLGLTQKGRSRTWLDDRGWYVGVVEFQPSGWLKGSYLNVGACFLWTWNDFLSFDLGGRSEGLVSYESDAQFAPEADRLAQRAAAEILLLRARLPAPGSVADAVEVNPKGVGWPSYHRAVSLGLARKFQSAAAAFLRASQPLDEERAWETAQNVEFYERCGRFAELVVDASAFRSSIVELIMWKRTQLKLSAIDDPLSG